MTRPDPFNRQDHAAANPTALMSNVQTLNQQYGHAWVSDLDNMTGGKLSQTASPTQLNILADSVANATHSGAYLEDTKGIYAGQLTAGFLGDDSVDHVIRGVQFSTVNDLPPPPPPHSVGYLPPTMAGQDQDLRASVATDMGIQLGAGGAIGDGSFGAFSTQLSPPAVRHSHLPRAGEQLHVRQP